MAEVAKETSERGFLRHLLRASLGGALGGFLWAVVSILISMGFRQTWWYWLLIGVLYQGLPIGLAIGVVVGIVIWLGSRVLKVNLGMANRFLIGSAIATMLAWIAAFLSTERGDFFPTPWHLEFLWIVFFGVATGGVAAMIAGSRYRRKVLDEKKVDLKNKIPTT